MHPVRRPEKVLLLRPLSHEDQIQIPNLFKVPAFPDPFPQFPEYPKSHHGSLFRMKPPEVQKVTGIRGQILRQEKVPSGFDDSRFETKRFRDGKDGRLPRKMLPISSHLIPASQDDGLLRHLSCHNLLQNRGIFVRPVSHHGTVQRCRPQGPIHEAGVKMPGASRRFIQRPHGPIPSEVMRSRTTTENRSPAQRKPFFEPLQSQRIHNDAPTTHLMGAIADESARSPFITFCNEQMPFLRRTQPKPTTFILHQTRGNIVQMRFPS